MECVIATNNEHKVYEYRKILEPFNIKCYSLKDLNIVSEPIENGKTFKENSLIKANDIKKYTNMLILADDSGLVIDALPDILGLKSARFMEGHSYKEKCAEVLKRLEGKDRTAHFTCSITLLNFKSEPLFFEGVCNGKIGYEYKGENGFGYDPIFISNAKNKTMAELNEDEKNEISHRGLACKKLIEFLKENM